MKNHLLTTFYWKFWGNVKDLSGIPYVVDGHLNYYLLNKGKEKYFQKVEEYTGEGVFKYHNFYLPIKVQNKFYVARIVGEEWNDSKRIKPIDVKLYDVIIAKKGTFSKATQGDLQIENVPFRITVAEMLKNVKDSNHQPFVNKDGTLAVNKNIKSSKAENEHNNNEGDYFQKGGQDKGGNSPESNAIHLFAAADQFTIMLCVYPLSYSSAASSGDGYTI